MSKKYKILFFAVFTIIFIAGTFFISKMFNKDKIVKLSNEYSEIIAELESLYGKERNFKVIEIIGEEIDQRAYRPSKCNIGGYMTSDWQGRYFKDAILRIAIDYDETKSSQTYFDVYNNICTIRSGYADRFVIGIESEHQFSGTLVDVYRNGAGLVVEPDENEELRKLAEHIYVPSRINVKYEVGMKVIVYYNGKVNTEVYPAGIEALDVLISSNKNELSFSEVKEKLVATKTIIVNVISYDKSYIEKIITNEEKVNEVVTIISNASVWNGAVTTPLPRYKLEFIDANDNSIAEVYCFPNIEIKGNNYGYNLISSNSEKLRTIIEN